MPSAATPDLQLAYRRAVAAHVNLPGDPANSPVATRKTADLPLLGPRRFSMGLVTRVRVEKSAHEKRQAQKREREVLALMRDIIGQCAAIAPNHFHPEATAMSVRPGTPRVSRSGASTPTVQITLHDINLFSSHVLPGNAARKLAERVALLAATDVPPAPAAPLPWRQYWVGSTIVHAPDGARALQFYLAMKTPRMLASLRDPDLSPGARQSLRDKLPVVSEHLAPDALFPALAETAPAVA